MDKQESLRMVAVADIVGPTIACQRHRIDRSTLVRRIAAGLIEPLKQLEGETGAYLFDVNDLPPVLAESSTGRQ